MSNESVETAQMSEAEEDLWDELWDTDAAHCCSCPSCNFYAPDYEQHKDEPCVLRTIIERIIAARLAPIEALADCWDREAATLGRSLSELMLRDGARQLRSVLTTPAQPTAEGEGTTPWVAFPGKVPVCRDCGTDWHPVHRGECSRCGSDAGPLTTKAARVALMGTPPAAPRPEETR